MPQFKVNKSSKVVVLEIQAGGYGEQKDDLQYLQTGKDVSYTPRKHTTGRTSSLIV